MSKKLLVLFVVLAAILAGCSLSKKEIEKTPTLVFVTPAPGTPTPVVISTRPAKPGNPNFCFDDLDIASGNAEQFMTEKFNGWYAPLVMDVNGIYSTGDNEKHGFISISDTDGAANVVVVNSGNAYRYGVLIPDISLTLGDSVYYGPTYKLTVPEIKTGTVKKLEYWAFWGQEYVRYLDIVVDQNWNGYGWETKKITTEAWYQIQADGSLVYAGTSQPTSP